MRPAVAIAAVSLGLVAAAATVALRGGPDGARGAHVVPALDAPPMTAEALRSAAFRVVPAMLRVVYDGFGETDEAVIYATLESVAAGDALEQLYLERAGAMAGGGLETSDQEIHEMQPLRIETALDGAAVRVDATWRVIGTVGHAEHMHMRGNAYTADLRLAPVDGAWRIVGFDLRDVDRSEAGDLVAADPAAGTDAGARQVPAALAPAAADPTTGTDPGARQVPAALAPAR